MPAWCTDCRARGAGFPAKQNAAAGECRSSSTASRNRGARAAAWNVRAYYAVKYLLIGGILAALLATAFA
jgi:hypothetical protein